MAESADQGGLSLLLPAQWSRRTARPDDGARRMLAALIEDAVHCFTKYAGSSSPYGGQMFEEAARWIFGPAPQCSVSFERACECLDLDPELVRRRLTLAIRRRAA